MAFFFDSLQLYSTHTRMRMHTHPCLRTCTHAHTHTHTHTHNHFTSLWNLSGTTRVSRYQKKHSPTHTHRGHQSSQSAFSIYYEPWHPPYSIHVLYSLFPQSLSKFTLVYLLAWYPLLHTPYISSPSHCLLFATDTHTIAACFAVVPSLSLNPLLVILSCSFTPHIHLTVLISAH